MNANSDKDYLDAKIAVVRAGMDGRLDAFEENVNGRFAETNAKIDRIFIELNAKIDYFSAELNAKIDSSVAELRKDIAEYSARMVQWMVGLFIASMAIFITVITFVLNNAVPRAQAAMPPVIIQLSPQGATMLPAAPPAKQQP
jgi:hypothetical protein